MEGPRVGSGPPRPPLLARVTTSQWTAIDIGLAGLFLLLSIGSLYRPFEAGRLSPDSRLILLPLCVVATAPIAVRRRWPVFALVCTSGAMAATVMLGHSLAPAPFIALPLYSVTVAYPRRQSLAALVSVEIATLLALGVAALARPVAGDVTFNFFLAGATWFVGDSVRTRRVYQAGLAEQAEERRKREMEGAERAIAEERLEIARELHDVVAHSLSVIAIQSGVGRHVIDSQPEEARKALLAVEGTSRSALDELRRVLGVLRRNEQGSPELSPAPALSDLESLIDRVRAAGVPVTFSFLGNASLPQALELSIYRIVQEALTNVAKHTRSAPTRVCIKCACDEVVVEVLNTGDRNGTGVGGSRTESAAGSAQRDGHGIIGMKERAMAFGGTLTALPIPEGGFRVPAHLPLLEET